MLSHLIPFDAPELERRAASELRHVVTTLENALGDAMHSIILSGSYGRGEGTVRLRGQQAVLSGDYDLVVILKGPPERRWSRDAQLELVAQAQSGVSVKQLDVKFTSRWKLLLPRPTVERYELKHASQLMWGRSNFIAACPGRLLPVSEGERYLRNRALGLILARLILDGLGPWTTDERSELATLEIDKAFIAIGDAWLIAAGDYRPTYRERLQQAQARGTTTRLSPAALEQYLSALDGRLSAPLVTNSDVEARWWTASRLMCQEFGQFNTIARKATGLSVRALDVLLRYVQDKTPTSLPRTCSRATSSADALALLRAWHPAGLVEKLAMSNPAAAAAASIAPV